MKNYYVEPLKFQDDFLWCVFETASEQMIKSFSFEEDALRLCKFLNRGGGFDGNTPPFFLKSFNLKEINNTFKETFA